MIDTALLTADSFDAVRYDLPDSGQWVELVRGRVEILTPPEEEHRLVVLHLSKALGSYLTETPGGYPVFDLGLIVARHPDTIRFPAISFFLGGEMFAEADRSITDTRPALVVEIMSSNDRRRSLNDRLYEYDRWGVEVIWVVDTIERAVHIIRPGYTNRALRNDEILSGSSTWQHKTTAKPILSDFRISVASLFVEPESWKTPN